MIAHRGKLERLRAKRERLVARAAVQREEIVLLAKRWEKPLAVADRGLDALEYVRARPGLVIAAVAIVAVLQPRRAIRWARRIWAAWRGYRWVSGLVARAIE